jgi:D-alanyl-lipoteichoic acid acyltransferase DltB (MBOAT superfamily)
MLFNSLTFLLFFPVALIGYYVVLPKLRHLYLLVVSYIFYMWWNPKYAVLLTASIVTTYLFGRLLGRTGDAKPGIRKLWVALGCVCNLGILIYFKYLSFFWYGFNRALKIVGLEYSDRVIDILLPVGISFYTFQALGYMIDVYRSDTKVEKNIFKYALFVSFFPQMVAGPIERSNNLLSQVRNVKSIKTMNPLNLYSGFVLILWGFFMKVVIADRVAVMVDTVYDSYWNYGTFGLSVATIGFAFQIYCDFASYSLIAIGSAKMMGFRLMENFNTPYFSYSLREFWHRWHISLSTWFRDYLYIPLGGNRKGRLRKYLNLMIVFTVSGLWHGAGFTYIVWGALHGLYQIIGDLLKGFRVRANRVFNTNATCLSYKLGNVVITFALTCFAWIFFRSDNMSRALDFVKRLFTEFDPWSLFDGELYELGLDRTEFNILFVAMAALFFVDFIKRKHSTMIDEFLSGQNLWFRWLAILTLLFGTIIFGAYGPLFDAKQFIYFQF